jgi:pimeloyl-ACP methyl ester carboxylesterase
MNRREFVSSSVLATTLASSPAGAQSSIKSTARNAASRAAQEELVTARTEDDIVQSGLLVTPARRRPLPVAVLWIHGTAQNFYFPSYVGIARAVAATGYPFLTANTRMHDLASFLAYRDKGDVRGGSTWGLPSKEPLDIAAWISYLETRGYSSIVLVGHGAGASAVRMYLAERQDSRVIGLVQASGSIELPPKATGPDVDVAREMVSKGQGQHMVPSRMRPRGGISADTFADFANIPDEIWDFFGVKSLTPAIAKVRCPLLAWYGSGDDIAKAPELDRLRSLIARQPKGPARVDTTMIEGAGHEYAGYEDKVAKVLTDWIRKLALSKG